jgi:hypothetical protein
VQVLSATDSPVRVRVIIVAKIVGGFIAINVFLYTGRLDGGVLDNEKKERT